MPLHVRLCGQTCCRRFVPIGLRRHDDSAHCIQMLPANWGLGLVSCICQSLLAGLTAIGNGWCTIISMSSKARASIGLPPRISFMSSKLSLSCFCRSPHLLLILTVRGRTTRTFVARWQAYCSISGASAVLPLKLGRLSLVLGPSRPWPVSRRPLITQWSFGQLRHARGIIRKFALCQTPD